MASALAGNQSAPWRIALIGCGAAVEKLHQPALRTLGVPVTAFFDTDIRRAQLLAAGTDALAERDFLGSLNAFDAAIVSVPHALHAPVASQLLRRGKHVLVEKPMATSAGDARAMIDAAAAGAATLNVALYRRFAAVSRWVKGALDANALGRIRRVTVLDGAVFRWPVTTDSFWRRESAGGGVLIDRGAHALDLLIWWLGSPQVIDFLSDDYGGVEADCTAELLFPGEVPARVTLSRLRNLPGTALIEGEKGWLEVGILKEVLRSDVRGLMRRMFSGVSVETALAQQTSEMFVDQLRAWTSPGAASVSRVDGHEGLRSVELVDNCYAHATSASVPWLRPWVM